MLMQTWVPVYFSRHLALLFGFTIGSSTALLALGCMIGTLFIFAGPFFCSIWSLLLTPYSNELFGNIFLWSEEYLSTGSADSFKQNDTLLLIISLELLGRPPCSKVSSPFGRRALTDKHFCFDLFSVDDVDDLLIYLLSYL